MKRGRTLLKMQLKIMYILIVVKILTSKITPKNCFYS